MRCEAVWAGDYYRVYCSHEKEGHDPVWHEGLIPMSPYVERRLGLGRHTHRWPVKPSIHGHVELCREDIGHELIDALDADTEFQQAVYHDDAERAEVIMVRIIKRVCNIHDD